MHKVFKRLDSSYGFVAYSNYLSKNNVVLFYSTLNAKPSHHDSLVKNQVKISKFYVTLTLRSRATLTIVYTSCE